MDTAAASPNGLLVTPSATLSVTPHESLVQRVEHALGRTNRGVFTVMEAIARDSLQCLTVIRKYMPAATAIASAIFPAETAGFAGATDTVTLILNAVATVEAKWAAGDESKKYGPQKLADVLSLTQSTVTGLLTGLGIHADSAYVTNLINIIVGILNVRAPGAMQSA